MQDTRVNTENLFEGREAREELTREAEPFPIILGIVPNALCSVIKAFAKS